MNIHKNMVIIVSEQKFPEDPKADMPMLEIFGCLAGSAEINGDLTLPLDEIWEAKA